MPTKESLIQKAHVCIAAAQLMLGLEAPQAGIEDQALALMYLPNDSLQATLERLTSAEDQRRLGNSGSPYTLLKTALQSDYGYAWSWHCNISMAVCDALNVSKEEGNATGALIMQRVFDIDTTVAPGDPPKPPPPPPPRNLWEQLNDL